MKKKLFRKLTTGIAASCLAVGMMLSTSFAALAAPSYGSDYGISYILSKYQYFVKDDLTVNNHTVGAFIVGGAINIGPYGDGAIVDSYAGNIKSVGNNNDGTYFKEEYGYGTYNNMKLYYGSKESSVAESTDRIQSDNYIDINAAYNSIEEKSSDMKDAAGKTIKKTDLKKYTINGQVCEVAVLDFTGVDNIAINEDAYETCDAIVFMGDNGDQSLDDFVKSEKIINILGDSVEIGGDQAYVTPRDDKKVILFASNSSGNQLEPVDGGDSIKANITDDAHGLKKIENTKEGGQLYCGGMKLIWNIPEATSVTTEFVPGHVVAPKAAVTIKGGNFEGGVIAKSVTSSAEGHFYPYSKLGTNSTGPVEPTTTTAATTEATTAATTEATTAATTEATTAATTAATTEATTEDSSSNNKTTATTENSSSNNKTTASTENSSSNNKTTTATTEDSSLAQKTTSTDEQKDENKTSDSNKTTADSDKTSTTNKTATGGSTDEKKNPPTDTVVMTGDDFNGTLPIVFMLLAGAGIIVCVDKKRQATK